MYTVKVWTNDGRAELFHYETECKALFMCDVLYRTSPIVVCTECFDCHGNIIKHCPR